MSKEEKVVKERKGKAFYYGSDQAVKDAGSFSFFTPLGTKVVTHVALNSAGAEILDADIVPGIAILDYEFVPGLSTDGASPINIASKKLYTFVRHQNSGSRNYDSPDLMNYCYSVTAAYAFVSECQRAYGIIKQYSSKNRYLGKALTRALGFDYDDLVADLAGFRQLININAAKLNALKIPSVWPAATRQWLFNAGVFKDGDIDKSQMYAFRSTVLWEYNETGTYVGSLTPTYIFGGTGAALLTRAAVSALFNSVINALVASEDINIMSGDILKAYGDKTMTIAEISEDYAIAPIWNEDMLNIFHNVQFHACSTTYSTNAGNIIWQDTTTNSLRFDPVPISGTGTAYDNTAAGNKYTAQLNDGIVDTSKDDPQPYDVMNMMSSKVCVDTSPVISGNNPVYTSFGTELFLRLHLYADPANVIPGSGISRSHAYLESSLVFAAQDVGGTLYFTELLMYLLAMVTKFDWAPLLTVVGGIDNTGGNVSIPITAHLGDVYNFSKFTQTDVQRAHLAIVLAAFDVD